MTAGDDNKLTYAPYVARRVVSKPVLLASLFVLLVIGSAWFASVSWLFVVPVAVGLLGLAASFIIADRLSPGGEWRVAVAVALLGLTGPGLVVGAIWLAQPHYHFVLPTNFQGGFQVIIDEKSGSAGQRVGVRGREYRIPAGGVLAVKNCEPLFGRFWRVTASYADGTAIPASHLWSFGSQSLGGEFSYWWFIGNSVELERAQAGSTPRLGNVSE